MNSDLSKASYDFWVRFCDMPVRGTLDFPTADDIENLAEFRNHSSAVGRLASGLQVRFHSLSVHWHGLTDQFTQVYGLAPIRIE
jgi:hypothetical protein